MMFLRESEQEYFLELNVNSFIPNFLGGIGCIGNKWIIKNLKISYSTTHPHIAAN